MRKEQLIQGWRVDWSFITSWLEELISEVNMRNVGLMDTLLTVGVEVLAWIIPKLSRKSVWRLGHTAGWLGYYMLASERRIALSNLDTVFAATKSRKEKISIARASFQNFVTTILLLFWAPQLTASNLGEIVEVDPEDLQFMREIFDRGQGALCVTFHYGNWELVGLASGFWGFPISVLTCGGGAWESNPKTSRILSRLRSRSGNHVTSARSSPCSLVKPLQQKEGVALLVDLNASRRGKGAWVNFFGLPVFNTVTVASLARMTRAPIVCCVGYPLPNGNIKIVLGPEVKYTLSGNEQIDLREISQKCLEFCEQVILRNPEHWRWAYKRWKRRRTTDSRAFPYYSKYRSGVG
jgi:Kdo2-lipid IVA lauroyltransferase/acyltransferase